VAGEFDRPALLRAIAEEGLVLHAGAGSKGDGEGLVGGARIDHQPLGAEIGRRQHGVKMPRGIAGNHHRRDGQGRLIGPRAWR